MTLLDNIILALNSIRSNFLRTILTLSIIAFGIMALVGILTAVDGITASLSSNFATMGANNFDIRKKGTGIKIGRRGRQPRVYTNIKLEQAMDFKEQFGYPAHISIAFTAATQVTLKYRSEKTNPTMRITGADADYLKVASFDVGEGRNFSSAEVASGRSVILIGNGIAEKLYGSAYSALDKSILVNNKKYLVVGVLASKGSSSIFSSDNQAVIPLLNARNTFGNGQTTYVITVALTDGFQQDIAVAEAIGLMRNVRGLRYDDEEDFDISTSDKLSSILLEQSTYITSAATIIGVITLLGGAIGLMNIMLVSVTERTREIGITKALGATRNTILTQFLVEAIVIGQIGGFLGIIFGILAGNGVSLLLKGPFIIPWLWMTFGVLICFVVGIVAGLYPAMRAAGVDPIESLRYE